MKIVGFLTLTILASSLAATDEIWPILWPLNDCAIPDQVHIGYGDWCTIDPEGPHPGIDFGAVLDDIVRNPGTGVVYSLGYGTTGSYEENLLVLGCDWPQDQGWTLGHIYCDHPEWYWNTDPAQGPIADWDPGESISYCGLAPGQTDPWRHLHLSWVEDWVYPPPAGYFVPGFTDPFEHIAADLAGLYQVTFKRVLYEENLWPHGTSGAWFMPDGFEEQGQFSSAPGQPYWVDFQSVICGNIDVAVSPYSAYLGNPAWDSMGVYSVGYAIDWINPYTEAFNSTESIQGSWHQRWLCKMEGDLPPGDTSLFRAIFLDGSLPDGSGEQRWDRFESAYIVTNCGARDPSEWADGWDNVATDPCISDWLDAICNGAWDTDLANGENRDASRNEEAFFPDGRYAVDVTAVSHGSRDIGTMRLPVEDITDPESPVRGVVVDNWPPHIVEARLFAANDEKTGSEVEYTAIWITGLDPAIEEEIRTLEHHLEEIRNPGSWVPLPEFTMPLDQALGGAQLGRPGNPPGLVCPINVHEVAGPPRTGVDQDRIDPTEFIQSRLDSLRGLDAEVLRYMLEDVEGYPDLSQPFGVVVRYSEPMSEEVIDNIWLVGTLGDDLVWDSRNSGVFQAQDPTYWPDADGLPIEPNWEAGRLEQAQGFWRVYLYEGDPPPGGDGFNGYLTLCAGTDDSSNELEGPRDLAGNALDGNPETISAPRPGYGPWIGPGGPVPRYEPKVDRHYSWGELEWSTSIWPGNQYFDGYCEEDLITSVDLEEIGAGLCERFLGDCGYNCGFWVYQEKLGRRDFDIQTILPDESYDTYHFSTNYPIGNSLQDAPIWMSLWNHRSEDGRYCWMSGLDLEEWPGQHSTGYIYAVDAATGATLSTSLCNGFWWWTAPYDVCLHASFIEILDVYSTGHAFVRCCYNPVYAGDPVIEYRLIAPPVPEPPSSEYALGTEYSSTTALADPAISLRSNPVDSSIEVTIPDDLGDQLEAALYEVSGRLVLDRTFSLETAEGTLFIDVSGIPSGIYYLRVEGDSFSEMMSVTVIH